MVYDALMIGVGVVLLIPPLARRYKPVYSLAIFSFFLAVSFVICILPTTPYALIFTIPPIGLCLAVTITNGSLVISNETSKEFQGQALGTLTSVQVLAEFFTGIVGGVLAVKTMTLPLYVGAVMSVMCGLVLLIAKRQRI
jgi:MFS family permease